MKAVAEIEIYQLQASKNWQELAKHPALPSYPLLAAAVHFLKISDDVWSYGSTDSARRFYINADERADCCESVRNPSRGWPWPELKHLTTYKHTATRFGVSATELKKEVAKLI